MRGIVVLWLMAGGLGFAAALQEESGNRSYRSREYGEAVERYRRALSDRAGTPRLHYNLGTALLEVGEAGEAGTELVEALQGRDPELRARAFYNLGNARTREAAAGGPEAAERLRAAIDAYRRSLLLDPGGEDARWNLELALHRLRQLEEQRSSMPGNQEQPVTSAEQEQDGGQESEGDPQPPPPGAAPPQPAPERPRVDAESAPLPPNLAEHILRAVEEQERGLQRERLRRQSPTRRSGPDW